MKGRALIGATAAGILLTGCTSTTAGLAVKAAEASDSDQAVIALLDTGPYAVTPGPPFPNAGAVSATSGNIIEAQRMAEHVIGPWQVQAGLRDRGDVVLTALTLPLPTIDLIKSSRVLPDPLPEVAGAHGFVAAFSTFRASDQRMPQQTELFNLVMRFRDPESAAVAASELAAQNPPAAGATPREPVPILGLPDTLATGFTDSTGAEVVEAFTAHGPFVFCQRARTVRDAGALTFGPRVLVQQAVGDQLQAIDKFVPTAVDKLGELPLDPTGTMLARTLVGPDNQNPAIIGAWSAQGWLHFERDPIAAATLFRDTGVDDVSQRLATVYRARDAAAARKVADALATQAGAEPAVRPVSAVPGLPGARCYVRVTGGLPGTAALSWQRVQWHYKCVAFADRYAFTTFSADEVDAKQQVSAQYRILAGR
jgi:hypothetical protein